MTNTRESKQVRGKVRVHNRRKAENEAVRLMKEKSDMFERYLRKPRNSSIGFIALSQAEKKEMKHNSRKKLNSSNYSISQGPRDQYP